MVLPYGRQKRRRERCGGRDRREGREQQVGERVADGDRREEAARFVEEEEEDLCRAVVLVGPLTEHEPVEPNHGELDGGEKKTRRKGAPHDDEARADGGGGGGGCHT